MLRAATREDAHPVCVSVADVFCVHEPMCKALEIKVSDFVQQFLPIIGKEIVCARVPSGSRCGVSCQSVGFALALPFSPVVQHMVLDMVWPAAATPVPPCHWCQKAPPLHTSCHGRQ